MLIWVCFVEPGTAQIAEMRVAPETDHMVAAHGLLASGIASRAGGGVCSEIFFGGFFFGCQLAGFTWEAGREFPVPACTADDAEGEGAVFTDSETFARGWKFGVAGVGVVGGWERWLFVFLTRICCLGEVGRFGVFL